MRGCCLISSVVGRELVEKDGRKGSQRCHLDRCGQYCGKWRPSDCGNRLIFSEGLTICNDRPKENSLPEDDAEAMKTIGPVIHLRSDAASDLLALNEIRRVVIAVGGPSTLLLESFDSMTCFQR
jgi:hypothetical protein